MHLEGDTSVSDRRLHSIQLRSTHTVTHTKGNTDTNTDTDTHNNTDANADNT